uniref:L1 transposable element RRM domain-containing protein n=1 Tax=Molossus molossus TaxID=27622 RepID=A0A7J8HH75_MOLMO|nr:hypothetical protein HJG59_011015 [Molossus molossus]
MKNVIAEIRNTLEGITSRVEEAEDLMRELEDRIEEKKINQSESQKEKTIKKQEDILREVWDNWKCNNICITGVSEEEKNGHGLENIFEELVPEIISNLVKKKGIQVQETQRAPCNKNPNRPTPRNIIIKMPKIKNKERILNAARDEQQVTY